MEINGVKIAVGHQVFVNINTAVNSDWIVEDGKEPLGLYIKVLKGLFEGSKIEVVKLETDENDNTRVVLGQDTIVALKYFIQGKIGSIFGNYSDMSEIDKYKLNLWVRIPVVHSMKPYNK